MSSPSVPRRRRRSDTVEHGESESPSPSPPLSNSKRPRLNGLNRTNGVGASINEAEPTDHDDNESNSRTPSARSSANRSQRLSPPSEDNSESGSDGDSNEEEEDSDDNDRHQRSSPNGDVSEEQSEDGESVSEADEDEESMPPPPTQPLRAQPGLGPDGYKPGAIVRIKVTNFVTYKSAEFFPGPKLNMVIGPNGTGKSTLVCAICLGLGWGPQHLGRAKDLGEFVKHGNQEATIEIELERSPGKARNPIITRTIKRDGNKSSFTLNGNPVSKQGVLKLAQSFAIQVDNLCQFLPQDKVAEFAALTPIDLLHSTERAAAGEEMVRQHEALKDLRRAQKNTQMDNRGDQQMLGDLKNRQEGQRADVDRMRKRAEVQQKIDNLELLRPWVLHLDYNRGWSAIKAAKEAKEQEHEQLKSDLEPALAAVDAKQTYRNQIFEVKTQRKRQVQQLSSVAQARGKNVEEMETSIRACESKIDAERKNLRKIRDEATAFTQKINRLKRRQQEAPVEFDRDYYNDQVKEKKSEKRQIEEKAEHINQTKVPLAREQQNVSGQIAEEERTLSNFDSRMGQQELKLQRLSREVFKAYRWVLENQDKFQKEVFGPPMVTCSVTDPQYASAVESLLNKNDLLSFTVQSKEDFRTLQRSLLQGLGLSDISIKTCQSLDPLTAPRPDIDLRQLGLDRWAQDCITGPDYVVAMLCDNNGLRRTPVGLNDISDQSFNALQATKGIVQWVSGRKSYKVSRRADIGAWASSTSTKTIRNAQVWTSQPVDMSAKRGHEDKIRDLKARLGEIEEKVQAQRAELGELRDEAMQIDREIKTIESEKSQKQTEYTEYRAIPQQLVQLEDRKKQAEERYVACRQRVSDLRNKQDKMAIQKAEAALEYAAAVQNFHKAFEELVQVEFYYLEAASDLQAVKLRYTTYGKRLEESSKEMHQLQKEFEEGRAKGKSIRRLGNAARDTLSERPGGEEIIELAKQVGYDMDHLNADLDSARAEYELNVVAGGAGLIKEFEAREQQIAKLEEKLASFHAKLNDLQTAIDEVRGDWEPKLDALIQKISDAFSDSFARIGCAGSVGLDKVESMGENGEPGGVEFDQWSIQIMVKFRENASLSLLDSHRQSGGERAVSTIFYLMALQSLSASPFRVVDEINQGMDPRNERMVHGRLVDIACASSDDVGGGGGQYFLITPKLLSGLSYKPGMRVLCIWSGEHMDEQYCKLNVSLAIRNMKKVLADGKEASSSAGQSQSQSQVGVYA